MSVCVIPTSCRIFVTIMLSEFALHIPFEAIRVCECYPNKLQESFHVCAHWFCPTHSFWNHKSVCVLSQRAAGLFPPLCSHWFCPTLYFEAVRVCVCVCYTNKLQRQWVCAMYRAWVLATNMPDSNSEGLLPLVCKKSAAIATQIKLCRNSYMQKKRCRQSYAGSEKTLSSLVKEKDKKSFQQRGSTEQMSWNMPFFMQTMFDEHN